MMAEIVFFLSSGPWVNGWIGRQELLSGFSAAPESKNPNHEIEGGKFFLLMMEVSPKKKGHQKGERFRSFLEVKFFG